MLGTGGATSFVALLSQVDWLAVIGVLIALSIFNFSWRRNKRENKLHMKKLQDEEEIKD
jgi:type III secretory pathway component EscU